MIQARFSKFLTSARSIKNAPPPTLSEVVFLGRSNVGKSTLINEILESNLAKSSSTPGKTKLINFFSTQWLKSSTKICEQISQDLTLDSSATVTFCIIDLPGIGYAKVSKEELKQWQKNLWEFILARSSIKLFLHLIDARHTNLEIDFALKERVKSIIKPDQAYLQVFTKADKLSKNDLAKLHQKNMQNNAIIIAYKDKIPQKYGSKATLREAIFNCILGNHNQTLNINNNICHQLDLSK